jgi:hypothetical protein
VKRRELSLEFDERMVGAGNISRTARARTHASGCLDHRSDHLRMLRHPEVVVGAPDHDVARAKRGVPNCVRETAGYALKVRKHPVTPFIPQPIEGRSEITSVIHVFYFPAPRPTF